MRGLHSFLVARISLRAGPLYINVDHRKEHSTVEGLEQVHCALAYQD